MSASTYGSAVSQVTAGLDALAAVDVVALDDQALREELLALLAVANRAQAELVRRVDTFDRRGLSEPDGFRTAKAWLHAFGRISAQAAHRSVKAARLLRQLPKLATAAQSGDIPSEHLQQVSRLADQVGGERVADVEPTLADAARVLDLPQFATVCARVQAHLDPDGSGPAGDPDRRALTLSPVHGQLVLRGQLDPEGGAAVTTALDALMTPPADGDDRSPAQRRADALVELARRQLTAGTLPTAGGQRPQVGVLLHPQALSPHTLAALAEQHRNDAAGQRLRELADDPDPWAHRIDWTRPGVPIDPHDQATALGRTSPDPADPHPPAPPAPAPPAPGQQTRPPPPPPRAAAAWSRPGWADPPWLNWIGPIPPTIAQRIACDADIWRIILDPTTGTPLDVGRGHRLVPHWIRRALHARDRGCRWPGCPTPAEWTDAHHLDPWADGGETSAARCLLLCRYHHTRVHEGGWGIDLDPATGEAHLTRPGGAPYHLPRTRSTAWNGPCTMAG